MREYTTTVRTVHVVERMMESPADADDIVRMLTDARADYCDRTGANSAPGNRLTIHAARGMISVRFECAEVTQPSQAPACGEGGHCGLRGGSTRCGGCSG